MGVIEILKEREIKKRVDYETEKKNHNVVENLISELGLSNEQTARIADVSVAYVEKVRKELKLKK